MQLAESRVRVRACKRAIKRGGREAVTTRGVIRRELSATGDARLSDLNRIMTRLRVCRALSNASEKDFAVIANEAGRHTVAGLGGRSQVWVAFGWKGSSKSAKYNGIAV